MPQTIEWTAPEFKKYKKNKNWFVLPVIIVVIVLIVVIILKNFLFGLAIVLAAFVFYIYATKEPRKIKFNISKKGIQVDQTTYEFKDLKSFWIFYNPEIKELSLRSNKTFIPYIKIPLADQDPAELRKLLLKFLPERKHQESAIDTWIRRIKF